MYKLLIAFFTLFLIAFGTQADDTVLSPFTNSQELASYRSRFAPTTLLVGPIDDKKEPLKSVVEGSIISRVFRRADDISDFEVYKSYLSTLKSSGFEILIDCEESKCDVRSSVNKTYVFPVKRIFNRPYKFDQGVAHTERILHIPGLVKNANYYISAKKTIEDKTIYAMIIASEAFGLYLIEELVTTTMEPNTTTLNLEALKNKINHKGKVVLPGLFFKTGSSNLTDESKPALDTIAKYLKENPKQFFYVVGHTDDTGRQKSNLSLSQKRAESVVNALKLYGIKDSRLSPQGVGPYSPANNNSSETGRELNRRVELVLRASF